MCESSVNLIPLRDDKYYTLQLKRGDDIVVTHTHTHSSANAIDRIVCPGMSVCFITVCIYQIDCQKISHSMNTSLLTKTKDRQCGISIQQQHQQQYNEIHRTAFEYSFSCEMKEKIYVSTGFKVNSQYRCGMCGKKMNFTELYLHAHEHCVHVELKTENTWRMYLQI